MEFKRIKNLREDNDKKQKDIAEYLKITQQQYSLYEKGTRTIPVEYVIKLSEYYNVSTDYLLGLSDEPKHNWKKDNNVNISNNKNSFNNSNIKIG